MCVTPVDASPTHLVVLLHGLLGSPANLQVFGELVRKRLGPSALVAAPSCFARLATLDGVDACGVRVLAWLRAFVRERPELRRLSLVGYSLGGLVARFLAGALCHQCTPAFLGLTPSTLLTIACPHLGVLRYPPGSSGGGGSGRITAARAAVLRALFGRAGAQLALADGGGPDAAPPLLLLLATSPGYLSGAAAFERRVAVAGADNGLSRDRTVAVWSAAIDPFEAALTTGGGAKEPPLSLAQLAVLPLLAARVAAFLSIVSAILPFAVVFRRQEAAASVAAAAPYSLALARCEAAVADGGRGDDDPVARMAASLGALGWDRSSVRFSVACDGLVALHTHGLLVVRHRRPHAAGLGAAARMAAMLQP